MSWTTSFFFFFFVVISFFYFFLFFIKNYFSIFFAFGRRSFLTKVLFSSVAHAVSRYTNKLLAKDRLAPIGAEESLPQAALYPTEKSALEACEKSSRCRSKKEKEKIDDTSERECETRQVEAERVSSDNSLWTFQCVGVSGNVEEGDNELTGFDTRTGMPRWDQEGESKTNTKSLHGVGLRPSSTKEHPIQLRNSPLTNPDVEKKKVSIFTHRKGE